MKSRHQLRIWIPLALNALCYLSWRDWSLWCFRWVELGHVEGPIRAWRGFIGAFGTPPEFVRFSLASGLWLFGVANALLWIWSGSARRHGQLLVLGLLALCWSTEAAQALGLMVGTADWSDVIAYGLGAGSALAIAEGQRERAHFSPRLLSCAYVGGSLLLATGAVPGTLWP